MGDRVEKALRIIDTLNKNDPNVIQCNGIGFPREYFLSKIMTEKLDTLYPNASKAVRIAARAHHIERWKIARDSYSMDKQGYHAWRNDLAKKHAETTVNILKEVGFDEEYQDRISDIILKKNLKSNEETQQLEDVACLVFLEIQFIDFIAKHDKTKLIDILQKTWGKMSEKARNAAALLFLPEDAKEILNEALK